MSCDPRRAPPPDSGASEGPLIPVRAVVEGVAWRVTPEARPEADCERLAQGWERRFVADEARVAEVVLLYRELGFETVADPVRAAEVGADCGDCRLSLPKLKLIYTRRARAVRDARGPEDSMHDPIEQLLEEHRDIMAEVGALRHAVEDLRRRGEEALPAALPALESVGRMMATRLLRHARKEDEALFPAIERALGTTAGPTEVMREEHRVIHGRADRFRETLRELNEVEHPAIVAGGARLRSLAQGGGDAAALAETGAAIIELLDLHFGKEEQILFPMAREILSGDAMAGVARGMQALDAAAPA